MPFISQVALGKRKKLTIHGDNYPTPDGTGIRDFIHVVDLAKGHVRTLENLVENKHLILNLGTGKGHSVKELIKTFEKVSRKKITFEIGPRREGDCSTLYADASKAKFILGWEAKLSLIEMCKDTWKWAEKNPNGYD